jgi:uncharacterized oligopeptide transporter (OPT) family protein
MPNATDPPPSRGPDGAAATAEYKLPTAGFEGTPEQIEQQWYEQCYVGRGDSMWQLTWRAVLMGSLLGGILSLTNLYIGLKSGWGFGVAITACILSYAIWTTLFKIGLVGTKMTVLENNCMQSTASSAGYSTGGTLVSAIAAYILVNNDTIEILTLMAWVFFLAVLGVTMAIPMKRQMINIEQLRFPSGIAAAETLRALHTTGGKGLASARALAVAGLLSATSAFMTMGLHLLHPTLASYELSALFGKLSSLTLGKYWAGMTVAFHWEPMFIAAGAITGIRVCTSMLIGGFLCWVVLTPWALERGYIPLTIEEPLTVLPAEVAAFSSERPIEARRAAFADIDPSLAKRLEWVKYAQALEWKGVMTRAQRNALLELSDTPAWQQAVQRLFVRSQYRPAIPPGAVPPAVVIPPELAGVVTYSPQTGLVAETLLTPAQYEALRLLSTDPEYQAAVADLFERSRLETVEPLWVSTTLAKWPDALEMPDALAGQIHYDEEDGLLLWCGRMSPDERDTLSQLTDNREFQGAVTALYGASADLQLPATLPAGLTEQVRFDADAATLVAIGPLDEETVAALTDLSAAPAYQYTVAQFAERAGAERAQGSFSDLVKWSLWGGAACMVTSALFAFAFQWRSVWQALRSLTGIFRRRGTTQRRPHERIETPTSWFLAGQLFGGAGIVILAYYVFGMPIWLSVLAILLSFFLAIVACRVCGETDTTPVGAMGKVTQLMYGVVTPRHLPTQVKMNVNLMAACITAGAADSSSDLLIDLKSGYMLGANPRKQFIAQFAGIFMGTLASVIGFALVVPNAGALGTAQFPAPAAQAWAAVAKLLSEGLGALHPSAQWAIAIGGLVGIVLTLLEKLLPKQRSWVPSAAGIGLAFTFPFYYSMLFFIGAVIGLAFEKRKPKLAEDFMFPVASGVIAGEALMGVAIIFWENGPQMLEQITTSLGW